MQVWLSPVRVTFRSPTFAGMPATLIVEGYGVAAPLSGIVIGAELVKVDACALAVTVRAPTHDTATTKTSSLDFFIRSPPS